MSAPRSLFALAIAIAASACSSSDPPPEPPRLTKAELMDPESCRKCHPNHVQEWSGSMHAYAADDPVFRAMNARGQRVTKGALGSFCVNCHAPLAVSAGATTDGLNLDAVPRELKGVTCYFCHTVERVEGTHNNPLRLADDLVMRGGIANPVASPAHRTGYSALHDRDQAASSSMCGACHDITTGHGAAIERTFAEWKSSVFAGPAGATCSQCHMEQSTSMVPIATIAGAPPRRAHGHTFAGVDVALTPFPEKEDQRKRVDALLASTLQTALCLSDANTIHVVVDNVGAGHGFPSGSTQDRRLWFEVRAYAGSDVVYESGAIEPGKPIIASTDPDLWLVRDCMFDGTGKEVHDFWEAASYETNQFPPLFTFDPRDPRFYQTHFERRFPKTGSITTRPDRMTLRVRLQPIGLDVLDDLVATGDLDAKFAAEMPTFDIGKQPILEWTAGAADRVYYQDKTAIRCVTKTNLRVDADKVKAPERLRCAP